MRTHDGEREDAYLMFLSNSFPLSPVILVLIEKRAVEGEKNGEKICTQLPRLKASNLAPPAPIKVCPTFAKWPRKYGKANLLLLLQYLPRYYQEELQRPKMKFSSFFVHTHNKAGHRLRPLVLLHSSKGTTILLSYSLGQIIVKV